MLLFHYYSAISTNIVMWLYTLALQEWGVQKFFKTTMFGVLLLRSIFVWEEEHS